MICQQSRIQKILENEDQHMKPVWPGQPGGYVPGQVAEAMIKYANGLHTRFTHKRQEHLAGDGKKQYPAKKNA